MSSKVIDHPYREFERAGWERAAESYADSFEAVTRLFAPALLDAVGSPGGSELLDVACGTGLITAMAASRGLGATGVDFSARMVAEAKKRYPSLTFREADAEALPFSDCSFDSVVINFGVHHFPFPVRALSEAHRVLRGGGRMAFTTWSTPEEHAIQKIVIDAVREAGNPGASLPTPPSGDVTDVATCLRLLREAGFDAKASRADKIEARLPLHSAQELIEMLTVGTVRAAALIRAQPAERMAIILAAVERAMVQYQEGNRFKIPAAAILAVGTKS